MLDNNTHNLDRINRKTLCKTCRTRRKIVEGSIITEKLIASK